MKNPMSVDGLVSWLENQDPNTTYDYLNITDCLCCRYFRFLGLPVESVTPHAWYDHQGQTHKYPFELNVAANPVGKGTRVPCGLSHDRVIFTYGDVLTSIKERTNA